MKAIEKYPEYVEDLRKLKKIIEYRYGKVHCSLAELDKLWREFSEYAYSASFLIIQDDESVEMFVDWVAEHDENS